MSLIGRSVAAGRIQTVKMAATADEYRAAYKVRFHAFTSST
jgi:hypothetical protein